MNSKFLPFNSIISPGFWAKFSEIVLGNQDTKKFPIWGYYGPSNVSRAILSVDHASFDRSPSCYNNQVAVKGEIILTKSLQEFKDLDKNALMAEQLSLDHVEETPQTLASFFILTHADLKAYVFTYWFGFPAISSIKISYSEPQNVSQEVCSILESSKLVWDSGFFILNGKELKRLNEDGKEEGVYGYLDPSGVPETPGWVVRNYIAYIVKKKNLESGADITLLSVRPHKKEYNRSCTFNFKVEFQPDWESSPKVLGWERNGDKISPKVVDLKSNLDPITLAESFVDFNLKLMKWRLFPEFQLDKMHQLKVCIIGAGTLGCNVARTLMGWGVRHMDLLDSGKVSYSNPVRQSLYTYSDSGKPKAVAAAENLKSIFPGLRTAGHDIHIPMPGHPTSPSTIEKIRQDFTKLEELVQSNDVIFLLTDTRESRWAPTMLGAVHNKLIINAALGFDSYVVMRHGREGEDLGCYFCTDVVAPGDSTQDRTLDQQCTVTRPGVSMIAGALAVELMTATLHASEGGSAESTLGAPAHSMRGWLSTGQQISPKFQRFDKCSACSNRVINAFREDGFELIVKALDDPVYLEKLSGLDELQDGLEGIVELDDDFESE